MQFKRPRLAEGSINYYMRLFDYGDGKKLPELFDESRFSENRKVNKEKARSWLNEAAAIYI